jgi:GNAT superfamily N-acetyltransferase
MSTDPLTAFTWSEATMADENIVLELMRAFYAEERLVFAEKESGAGLKELLGRAELGRIFLLRASGAGEVGTAGRGEGALGHLVLTFGFSLEFRGRFVLLDELYVRPELRGKGWGRSAIEFAAKWASEQGAASLRLEVNHANRHAKAVYSRRGFCDDRRDLMTRWL